MREKVFSLTKKDFDWEYFRAGGKGGQNQNKTSSGVRIRHTPSGTVAESREARDQLTNKRLAFQKLTSDPKFRAWLHVTVARLEGIPTPEEAVEASLIPDNLKIEVKDCRGKWVTDA